MKTLIFDSENGFSHKILIFSPSYLVDSMVVFEINNNSKIILEKKNKKLADEELKIRDFENYSSTPILHKVSFFDLYKKHPWYFEEIKKKADQENFIPSITYVCELIINHKDHTHLPKSTSTLKKEIHDGKIRADYYDKFGEIEEIGNLFLNYFKLHLNEDSLICFWNLFVNSKSSFADKIKKMLIDFKKEKENIFNKED